MGSRSYRTSARSRSRTVSAPSPPVYAQPQGRKTADTSGGLWGAVSHPNTIAWIVYGVAFVLLVLIVLIPILIVRGAKKRKARRAAKAAEA